MDYSQITSLPNLISLSRVAMIPLVGYYLSRDDTTSMLISALFVILAGVSDGLDGYLARRLGKISRLGVMLDPLADKLFAAGLIILLVFYRNLPIWLAATIVGRDLLIIGLGAVLMRGREIDLPSNLIGKYAFASIAMLIGCYVIRFDFGAELFTWLTLVLLIASSVGYAQVMLAVRGGGTPWRIVDRPLYRNLRIIGCVAIWIALIYKLYFLILTW
ncbi:MAG: CDP-alcohol phosphatidyltransferase family protein [candidate division Zixibacteria bacterium]|nr:CDP-alcohol phosphatidyltransferase family protein [candidate division Zixibacteria bacterium]MDH4033281.1 CDP-alcohol phosphatidyltransferase family protein [candidate division Zixibacteria bacterium]